MREFFFLSAMICFSSCVPKQPFPDAHTLIERFKSCNKLQHSYCEETIRKLRELTPEQKVAALRYEGLAWHPPSDYTATLVAEDCLLALPPLLSVAEGTSSSAAKLDFIKAIEKMKFKRCDMMQISIYLDRIEQVVNSISDESFRSYARNSINRAFSLAEKK